MQIRKKNILMLKIGIYYSDVINKILNWIHFQTPHATVSALLVLGTISHTFSLLSSSFVEEEHQTWYFLSVSAYFLLAGHALSCYSNKLKVFLKLCEERLIKLRNAKHVRFLLTLTLLIISCFIFVCLLDLVVCIFASLFY